MAGIALRLQTSCHLFSLSRKGFGAGGVAIHLFCCRKTFGQPQPLELLDKIITEAHTSTFVFSRCDFAFKLS